MFRRARTVLLIVLIGLVVGHAAGSPSNRPQVGALGLDPAAVAPPAPLPGAAAPVPGEVGAPGDGTSAAPGAPATLGAALAPGTAAPTVSTPPADPASLGERQLILEADAVDRAVAVHETRVESAAQAHEDMVVDLARLRARLDDVRARRHQLRREATERAVALYVNPRDDPLEHVLATGDLNDGAVRQAFATSLAGTGHAVGDGLRRIERDLRELEASVEASEADLRATQQALTAQTVGLAPLQERRIRLSTALRQRIEALGAEASGHAVGEASILRIIAEEAAPPPPEGPPPPPPGASWPADGEVTSEFGIRWGVLHRGIDIAGPEGTPVVASRAGRIIEAGWSSGYGLTVIVDHGAGFTTLYAHLSATVVGEGDEVAQGQHVGDVGSTGNSTGPHLHFETRQEGEARDPRELLP